MPFANRKPSQALARDDGVNAIEPKGSTSSTKQRRAARSSYCTTSRYVTYRPAVSLRRTIRTTCVRQAVLNMKRNPAATHCVARHKTPRGRPHPGCPAARPTQAAA